MYGAIVIVQKTWQCWCFIFNSRQVTSCLPKGMKNNHQPKHNRGSPKGSSPHLLSFAVPKPHVCRPHILPLITYSYMATYWSRQPCKHLKSTKRAGFKPVTLGLLAKLTLIYLESEEKTNVTR